MQGIPVERSGRPEPPLLLLIFCLLRAGRTLVGRLRAQVGIGEVVKGAAVKFVAATLGDRDDSGTANLIELGLKVG